MCIITLVPLGLELPVEAIEKGACANPDGHGWAVASAEHGLVMGKDMDKDTAIAACIAERERQGTNSVVLFHSRIGTHGSKTIENVHPFYVPDHRGEGHDMNTVMAHNGVMPGLWHPDRRDPRSDTRVFTDRMATFYITERGVPSRRGARFLGDMIGKGNKLVFLSTRMPGRPLVRIVNATSGVWDEGIWYSNESYKRSRYRAPHYSSASRTCSVAGCKTSFYNTDETMCYQHREAAKKEAAETKESPKATPVTGRQPGWVSPYGGQQSYTGYEPEGGDVVADLDKVLAEFEAEVKADDLDADRKCDVCRTTGTVHLATNICVNCKWCLDCYQKMQSCTCFDYAAWWERQMKESEELAAALEADAQAAAEQAEREAAEEEWLARPEEEQIEALMSFYGMTRTQALKVLGDYKVEKASTVPSTSPAKVSGR